MTRYLIDTEAFENTPAIWQAALRQRGLGDCTEYTHIYAPTQIDIAQLAVARRQGWSVLTTPDRAHLWEPVTDPDCNLLRWALESYGVEPAKARELAKKDRTAFERSKTWKNQGLCALDTIRLLEEVPDISFEWTPFAAVQQEERPDREYTTERDHDLEVYAPRPIGQPEVMVALDFETVGDYPFMEIVGFSYSSEPGIAHYVPLGHTEGENASLDAAKWFLRQIVAGPWVAHNAIFEYHCLLNLGITPEVLPDDTMLLAWLAGQEKSLKKLAKDLLGEEMTTFAEVTKGKASIAEVSIERTTQYAACDADMTLRLWQDHFLTQPQVYFTIDKPLIPILVAMERWGIRVDVPWLEQWEADLDRETAGIEKSILAMAGLDPSNQINLNSPEHVQWLLFTHLGLEPQRATATGYSTDDATLRLLASQTPHPVLDALLDYRGKSKLAGTYARGLAERALRHGDDRVHPRWNGTGTRTGRLSSADPNGQNVPPKAREAFRATEGMQFFAADYSQIELRILAQLSGDPVLLEAFQQGISPHMVTLEAVFGLTDKHAEPTKYTLAKNVNFGDIYGMAEDTFIEQARKGGVEIVKQEATRILREKRGTYPRSWEWINQTKVDLMGHGYVDTLQGKRSWYPDVTSPDRAIVAEALRQGVNAKIQGTAGYFGKEVMVQWWRMGYQDCWPLVLNVHDELVGEAPAGDEHAALAILMQTMKSVAQRWLPDVPVEVEGKVADRWSDLK